ncbi:NTP transferase domain-containing protein [Hymenobacter sp. B81]|uniref:nucleotidyltransferase family protein n=1 Tax=Hymenobacter sp. B81 TaxID=3344878 RepID=UPI0037DD590B
MLAAAPDFVAVLLLAAGASSRMGRPKQLLPYRGRSLLRHAAETAVAVGCGPVLLVTGAEHETLLPEVAGLPVQVVPNAAWAEGLSSSIRAGLAAAEALPGRCRGVLIVLADQPLVTPALLGQLVALHRQSARPIVAAAYDDGLGVPALFGAEVFAELRALRGAAGARHLLAANPGRVQPLPGAAALLDVDTPADYARLLAGPPAS